MAREDDDKRVTNKISEETGQFDARFLLWRKFCSDNGVAVDTLPSQLTGKAKENWEKLKADELKKGEEMIDTGRKLVELVTPFRPGDAPPLDAQLASVSVALTETRDELGEMRGELARARQERELLSAPDARGRAETHGTIPPEGRRAQTFAVTLEPAGGAQSPTGEMYLKGAS